MIFHVYANQSNVGDWVSARGIQSLIAPRTVHELFCDEPFVASTLAVLDQAGTGDFIIIGGGGLFMEYFAPFWEGFRAIARRVPFVIWGAGACDLKRQCSRLPEPLLREIVSRSRLCVVRDELTREMLGDGGLPPPVICPAVVSIPAAPKAGRMFLHVDHYDSVGPENYERMVVAGTEYARRTGRGSRRTNNLIPRGNAQKLEQVLGLYAAADLVLSSRLHGCILAVATGRPVLAVSGDHKVESFMRAAGLSSWTLDLNDIEALPGRLECLPRQRPPEEFLAAARRQNRAVAAEVCNLIDGYSNGTEGG